MKAMVRFQPGVIVRSNKLAAVVTISLGLLGACTSSEEPTDSVAPPIDIDVAPAVYTAAQPNAVAQGYEVEVLVPGSCLHGVHGLAFDHKDNLYAASILGMAIYKVAVEDNQVSITEHIGPQDGMADDLDFAPNGQLCWTSFALGKVHCKVGDEIRAVAEDLPGIDGIAFNRENRLFVTQVFLGDALYEVDLDGADKPRLIAKDLGGLNAFEFGEDGRLYGPLWHKGEIVSIDIETGEQNTIATGFDTPSAVDFDSEYNLYALDFVRGEVVVVDIETGEKETVATLSPTIDNLAINSKDELFVSNISTNGIYRVDQKTGQVEPWVEGQLSAPGGLAVDGDDLYLADVFALRKINGNTGEVTTIADQNVSELQYPFVAEMDGDNLLLSSWFTGTIQQWDLGTNKAIRTLEGFVGPYDMKRLKDGSILVAEMGNFSLIRVSGSEGENREVVAEDLVGPMGLALSGENDVYVTQAITGTVTRVDLSTGEKQTVASGLKMPEGIAVRNNGKLLVVEVGKERLVEIDPISGTVTPLVEALAVGALSAKGMPPTGGLSDVVISESGAIYISADIDNTVYKITHE